MPGGTLGKLYAWASSMMIAAVLIHLLTAGAMKAFAKPREITWVTGVILGFTSANGAYGGFIIPITFGKAIQTGSPQTALIEFLVFYVTCGALIWWFYARRGAEALC